MPVVSKRKAWCFWLSTKHHEILEATTKKLALRSKAEAVRHAVNAALKSPPTDDFARPYTGESANRWQVMLNEKELKSIRRLARLLATNNSDAVRIAIELLDEPKKRSSKSAAKRKV